MTITQATELLPLPDNDDTLIRRADLPRYLPVAVQTLARWAHEGKGPAMTKVGRTVAYRVADVRAWLASQRRQNTILGNPKALKTGDMTVRNVSRG